ncbi:Nucleoporin nup35, partial [Lunasporangiospora selenospora]
MFTFQSSSSEQGRSSQGSSSKVDYIPSSYIAKQLALEEEAKRRWEQGRESDVGNGSGSSHSSSPHDEAPSNDMSMPRYYSGTLGYKVPAYTNRVQIPPAEEFPNHFERRASMGTGIPGAGVSSSSSGSGGQRQREHSVSLGSTNGMGIGSSSSLNHLRSNSLAGLSNLDADSAGRKSGILRSESRGELSRDELLRRGSTTVRFSMAAPGAELGTAKADSSASTATSASGLANGSNSNNSNFNNRGGAILKDSESVNVLGHRAASGSQGFNSSLGPAPGSVSGGMQSSSQGFTSSSGTGMGDILGGGSIRDSNFVNASGTGVAGSFFMGADGTIRRSTGAAGSASTGGANLSGTMMSKKTSRDDDDEDKDKERYMPRFLLNSTQSLKGPKIEPFVDGKDGWEREAQPRVAPHLLGDDVPPAETLDDIAHKEGLYLRPALASSQLGSIPRGSSRTDIDMGGSDELSGRTDEPYDAIITYGFPPEATSYILNQFRSFGTVARYRSGTYGAKEFVSFNWLKIQYRTAWSAKNARSRHLKAVGRFLVGVNPCWSYSRLQPDSMAMDDAMDEDSVESDQLMAVEARELEAGMDALLVISASEAESAQSQSVAASRSRPSGLYQSWSQGGSKPTLGQSQQEQQRSAFGPYSSAPALSDTTTRRQSMDSGEDDIASILGRSLTSGGGSFVRSRGRDGERVNGDIHGSRSLDQHGGCDSEQKRGGGFGDSVGINMDSQGAESSSMGFRPLFGHGESKGLSAGLGSDTGSRQQQQQDMGSLYGSHRSSTKPKFGESSSGSLLMASTTGMLSSGSTPFHVHKKQRLSSGLSRSTPVSHEASSSSSGANGSASLFGRGRGMTLIDDSSKADEIGRPLASTGGSTASSSGASGSASGAGPA